MKQKNTLSAGQVFLVFLKLGLTSFGGPVAHLGYFREEFVVRRRLLREETYADLMALCQFLPGPASSQVGMAVGLSQAGFPGALAAWTGFTLPSAVVLILFAFGVTAAGDAAVHGGGWLHGLKIAAVAVVAQAAWGMAKSLCPDRPRKTMALAATALVLAWPGVWGQIGAIAAGGLCGVVWMRGSGGVATETHLVPVGKKVAVFSLALFFSLLFGLPLLAAATGSQVMILFDSFFRSGALVFGGGHVVLPLLQAEVVNPGWVGNDLFLAGYGATQAVPGPLFTFSAYLGAVMGAGPGGWAGGALCLTAIFLPSFLLVTGMMPFWDALRRRPMVRPALAGINAAVVGLLLAALYIPVWSSGILSSTDFILGLAAFGLLAIWKVTPWIVVGLCALGGALMN
ncbi:chromate efflux transporter [Desulfuromonas sp. TF]|uniref:chromate efflux transporter n=1 Tax=Desulfuromonas sp. TF TaxID=1232410 RepID=UPI0003F91C59|nr:chromate efflux transporter [Desulfuromonas sp. TF]